MTDVRDATDALLSDRPDLKDDLQTILRVDAEYETWSFDDIPVSSGAFGEFVSRGIVEKSDGEYRLADHDAVRAAIEGEEVATHSGGIDLGLSVQLPPRRVSLALTGALLLVVAFRLFAYQSVFRTEHIVLLGNDPYYYRYWIFQLVKQGAGVFSLPEAVNIGEPFLIATLLATTNVLGGTTSTANLVLAWYPVVAALITALLVYILAETLTEDRRIGLAAVVLLAVTPAHAYRTAIGFADHHAFDFLWLAVTAVAATSLLQHSTKESQPWSPLRNQSTLGWATVLGIGVAAQVLAWNAGPILLLPLAVYGVIRTAAAAEAKHSPLADLSIIGGVMFGGMLALAAHVVLGWQHLYIVATPFLLASGLGAAVAVGELARRRDLSGAVTFGTLIAAGGIIFAAAYIALPGFAVQFTQEVVRLFTSGSGGNIAETASLFSPRYGTIVGPFFFFGLSLFFALPYIVWALFVGWSKNQPSWLLIGSYGGLLFVLALFQVRFAGQLALFVSVFAGLSLVHLLAIIGATERPAVLSETENVHPWHTTKGGAPAFSVPDRQTIMAVSLVFLLIGGLGAVMTPLRTDLLTVSDESYNAATFMEDYSEKQGWKYPQNYVFSEWGDVRMYNAFVNGHSRNYTYARANYEDFLTSSNSEKWYKTLRDRAGFIVTKEYTSFKSASDKVNYEKLHKEGGMGTRHFRVVYASSDGSTKVFSLVPGVAITGPGEPNSTFTIRKTLTTANGKHSFTKEVEVNRFGVYQTTLPYAGNFTFGGEQVSISKDQISEGAFISKFDRVGAGYWAFDEGTGMIAYDRAGGHHAKLKNVNWATSENGDSTLKSNGDGYAEARISSLPTKSFTISVWVRPAKLDTTKRNDFRYVLTSEKGGVILIEENGAVKFDVPGVKHKQWAPAGIPTDEWSHITVTYNTTHRTLYLDGEKMAQSHSGEGKVRWGDWIRIAGRHQAGSSHGFNGQIDELRIFGTALNESEVRQLYKSNASAN